jgi:hypothetical protein
MNSANERASDLMSTLDRFYGRSYPDPKPIGNAWKLAKRMIRKQDRGDKGRVLPIYVAVQEVTRHYGGPEEGGWWYNWTETVDVYQAWNARDALAMLRELKDEYQDPRYGIYSCANRGEGEYHFVIAHDPSFWTEHESTKRPIYE